MGDVISSHLDETKREIITARTGKAMVEFGRLYEQQYPVALFNKVRFDVEGGGGPQPQLLHRKVPLENKSIFSGSLFQYLEENKKWRTHFFFIPQSYNINSYDNKSSHDRRLHPKGTINCAGYKVLTSMEQYLELISNILPGVKAKVSSSPFLKCATQFPLILWHPFRRHYYFCASTEKEQQKWCAVLQDCVRHANDGLSEEDKVEMPTFTDALRLYRQAQGHYGTWEMMCGEPSQILSNLVMESLIPELRDLISPRLKGKMYDRQRNWMLISDAIYSLVEGQCKSQYEAVVKRCEEGQPSLEASIRTDMDQIITSKEHVTNKIRAAVLPKAEKLLKVSIEPYITSILDALMEPTSRGFSEVRDVFFKELVDMCKNTLNDGSKETVAQHMEKISMLAFHPVKMQSCYEKVEQLSLEGLQQRFDVSSPSVFAQRAQILMREQMDDAVYTFEQILHQILESQGSDELCKTIQRCQDRVIKKFDYDSSTVRKRFFREALLQIFIPYMLKQLAPSCASELPRFQELIFEDFSRFILVENIFEEVVLHSVMKDIMMAVKEAAVQRRHNLYRDSIVLGHSDPNLHLLGEKPSIDWVEEYGAVEEAGGAGEEGEDGEVSQKRKRMKQVVSMVQDEGTTVLPNESCVEGIPEEGEGDSEAPSSTDSQQKKDCVIPEESKQHPPMSNGLVLTKAQNKEAAPEKKKITEEEQHQVPNQEPAPSESPQDVPSTATRTEQGSESAAGGTPEETAGAPLPPHDDSGFLSPSSVGVETKEVAADAPQSAGTQVQEAEGVAAAPCTDTPQCAEVKEAETKEGVAAAPCIDTPQHVKTPAEEEAETNEGVAATPCIDAPQSAEEVKEAETNEGVAATPCIDAPQSAEEVKEAETKEGVAAAPCTDAPQSVEVQVKEAETNEGVAAAPCTDAPQIAETHVELANTEEGVAPTPCTDAPQSAGETQTEAEQEVELASDVSDSNSGIQ